MLNFMVEYLDDKGKKLEKGFYKDKKDKRLLYFTGGCYQEIPVFDNGREDSNNLIGMDSRNVRKLVKISKEEIRSEIKGLRNKTNWMERRLKEK
jgi:hypothetical protein